MTCGVSRVDEEELFEKLEELAETLGIEVRYDRTGGRSGTCMLHGRKLAIIDAQQPLRAKADALARALADEDHDHIYLAPELRLLLETYREEEG